MAVTRIHRAVLPFGVLLVFVLALIVFTGSGLAQDGALNVPAMDPAVNPGASPFGPLGTGDREAWEWDVVRLVNQERANEGNRPPLKRNGSLDNAAYGHSRDMGELDYFSHTGLDGSSPRDRVQAAGYNASWIGENIAAGYSSPAQVMNAWMNSSGHRANILNTNYREFGVGYFYDAADTYPGPWGYNHYWTQNFGRRSGVYPIVVNREAYSTTVRVVQLYVYGPSDALEMRFSNDGTNWSFWEPYATDASWTLAEGSSGARTVYAQVSAGSDILEASDDIFYSATAPVLSVTPETITFLSQRGSGSCVPQSVDFRVFNDGGGSLNWGVTEDSDWFDVATSEDAVSVTCEDSVVIDLPLGAQTEDITVTAAGALGSPRQVTVRLVVADEYQLLFIPTALRSR